MPADSPLVARARRLSLAASQLCALSGLEALAAQVADVDLLKGVAPFYLGMKVALIGLATLLEYLSGTSFGIDDLLLHDDSGTMPPGRMAPQTAFMLALCGLAVLLLDWRVGRRRIRPAQALALIVAFIAVVSVGGYAADVRGLIGFAAYTVIALQTAVTFTAVGLALLTARPTAGWIGALSAEDSAAGTLTRRLLPAVILVPLALTALERHVERAGLDESVAIWLFTSANIFVLLIFTVLAVSPLERADQGRRKAETTLRRSEERYRGIVELANDGIWTIDASGEPPSSTPAWPTCSATRRAR